jgi:hypothetical protein
MTDRTFTSTNTFGISERRLGEITVECWDKDIISVEIDGSDWACFDITPDEFQAMFDWAKAQGLVK